MPHEEGHIELDTPEVDIPDTDVAPFVDAESLQFQSPSVDVNPDFESSIPLPETEEEVFTPVDFVDPAFQSPDFEQFGPTTVEDFARLSDPDELVFEQMSALDNMASADESAAEIGMSVEDYMDATAKYYDQQNASAKEQSGGIIQSIFGKNEKPTDMDLAHKWKLKEAEYVEANKIHALKFPDDPSPLFDSADIALARQRFYANEANAVAAGFSLNPNTWNDATTKMVIAFGGLMLQAEMKKQSEERAEKIYQQRRMEEREDYIWRQNQNAKNGGGKNNEGGGAKRSGNNAFSPND